MEINFEQAQYILDFVEKSARGFCVPAHIFYDYIDRKAGKNKCTIIEQIDKINESIEVKPNDKIQTKRKVMENKLTLHSNLHKYWKMLVDGVKEEKAVESYQNFKNYYSYLKVYGEQKEIK